MDITNFIVPCILMGIGISIDITIATLSKFRDLSLSLKTWTLPLSLTHIVFPALGYFVFWIVGEKFPSLNLILGLLGFILVFLLVYEVVCESIGIKPKVGISQGLSDLFGFSPSDSRRYVAVLAVSWDALLSGPAQAAQATAGDWSTAQVTVSFFVAGLTVATVSQSALFSAKFLRKVNFSNAYALAQFNFWGKFIELSVIGGFGFLSLFQGVLGQGNLYTSILVSGWAMTLVFFRYQSELIENALIEAEESVKA